MSLVLLSCVSAYRPVYFGSQESSPFLPPQIPLGDAPTLSGSHEFVSSMFLLGHINWTDDLT